MTTMTGTPSAMLRNAGALLASLTLVWSHVPGRAAELTREELVGKDRPDAVRFLSPMITRDTPGHALDVEADIRNAEWLSLVVTVGGDGYGCDHTDWLEPRLIGPKGELRLTDLDWEYGTTGWGRLAKNMGPAGTPFRVEGKPAEYGIGTHSPSILIFEVPAGYHTFRARAALDDTGTEQGGGSTIQVAVLVGTPSPDQLRILGLAPIPNLAYRRAVKALDLDTETGAGKEFGQLFADLERRGLTGTFHGGIADAESRAEQTVNPQALLLDSDRDPVDVVLRRTRALLEDLRDAKTVAQAEADLAGLEAANARIPVGELRDRVALFSRVVALRRRIAFANPLLAGIDRLLFITREALPPDEYGYGNHMCDQFFGFHATQRGTTKGDGLYVLEQPFGDRPTARNLLEDSVVESGRLQGGKLETGGFLAPDLSFDGTRILFAYTEGKPDLRVWNEQTTFHVFRVNTDGTGLVQLTDGPVNDIDPCWLPNGRVVFISERRGGYGRCHGRPVPSYTLHSMHDDGTDIVCLSPHETNEWQPSVDNAGMVVYTRWDYVDRGFNQAHHAWITYPDGRDARALNGNTHASERTAPHMEMDVRAIPGSHRYVAIATGHHAEARGSMVLIDPKVPDDDAMAQVKRITPDQLFPEAEFYYSRGSGAYATPWPLSEKYYLCVYDHDANAQYGEINAAARNYGIYLVDVFGNRELIYRNPDISCLSPMPLRPRPRPPVIPHATLVGIPPSEDGVKPPPIPPEELPRTARVGVTNVYDSLRPFPGNTRITHLRIWQILPKTTPVADAPRIGHGTQKPAKACLGTVPVEPDGSAFWEQPVGVPVLFHALDENGAAVQGMRSATYAHPGEVLLCKGCHEPKSNSAARNSYPAAMQRPPSRIEPEPDGTNPFSFPRLVQPVLDRNCVECHRTKEKAPDLTPGDFANNPNGWYASFANLRPYTRFYDDAAFVQPYTVPGEFGARASKLYDMIGKGHHDLKLPPDDLRRLVIWLDSNCLFYGHEGDIAAQAAGELVPPPMQ